MDDSLFAGERFGLEPLKLREGLENGTIPRLLTRRAWGLAVGNEMAPEKSEPYYTALGAMQPEVTFGV